jgi:hypothetical protein
MLYILRPIPVVNQFFLH